MAYVQGGTAANSSSNNGLTWNLFTTSATTTTVPITMTGTLAVAPVPPPRPRTQVEHLLADVEGVCALGRAA